MPDLQNLYQKFSRTIPNGDIAEINTFGGFLLLLSNTGSNEIEISIGGQAFSRLPVGLSIQLPDNQKYSLLRFRNDSGATATIEFTISASVVLNSSLVVANALVVNSSSNTIETPAVVTATNTAGAVSIAGDTTQREIVLQNNSVNTIWVGDSDVDGSADRGIKILSGDTLILSTEAEIFLHAPAGDSDLSYMRLQR